MSVKYAWLLVVALCSCRRDEAPEHFEKARLALHQQQPEIALQEFKMILDVLERNPTGASNLYRARALKGAADLYAFELHDTKRAVEVYRELIAVCPEEPPTLEGRIFLGTLLWREFRDLRGAIGEFTQALARNPPQSAELSFTVAKLYFELQDYEQSALEARKVVQKFETSSYVDDAMLLEGQALAMMAGRQAEAEHVWQELQERFPQSELIPHALVELGRLRVEAGALEQAIQLWIAALKTHPNPQVVQQQIQVVRQRLRATTPSSVGNAFVAFDRDVPVAAPSRPPPRRAKTSAEAVGGTAEEAQRESSMPAEHAQPKTP